MSNELAKQQKCILLRSGVEIWVDLEKAEKLETILVADPKTRFIKFENKTFNSTDVVGIFPASDMEDRTRRKNGEWQCLKGYWHDRGEKCDGHFKMIHGKKVTDEEFKQYCDAHGIGVVE
jgi:hypothetical protein